MKQIPLQELYGPIQEMQLQIDHFETLLEQVDQLRRSKQKAVLEKLISLQEKKENLIMEKQQVEEIYANTNLKKEQIGILTNANTFEMEFYQVYKILEEQEKISQDLVVSDKFQKLPKKYTEFISKDSLLENIDCVRQAAFCKLITHFKKNYDKIENEELILAYSIFGQKIKEQIIFVLRFKFSSGFAHIQWETNEKSEIILEFQQIYIEQYKQIIEIVDKILQDQDDTLQIIDQISQDYFNQMEQQLKMVDSYYEVFEIAKNNQKIIDLIIESKTKTQLIRLQEILKKQKERTAQLLCNQLSIIRYNISSINSYQPLTQYFDKLYEILQNNDEQDIEEIFNTLYNSFSNMIKQKLQKNQYNRSSKIFSINSLIIVNKSLQQFKQPKLSQLILLCIEDNKSFLIELINKLCLENIKEVADKQKLQNYIIELNNKQILHKDPLKRFLKLFISLDDIKNDLYFEISLVFDEDIQKQIIIEIAETFTTTYYSHFYNYLLQYAEINNQQFEFNEQQIIKIIDKYKIAKELQKIPKYIRDPESYKMYLMI